MMACGCSQASLRLSYRGAAALAYAAGGVCLAAVIKVSHSPRSYWWDATSMSSIAPVGRTPPPRAITVIVAQRYATPFVVIPNTSSYSRLLFPSISSLSRAVLSFFIPTVAALSRFNMSVSWPFPASFR